MSLTKWFAQDWVDIGAPKKGGGYKRAKKQGVGGKPTNVSTFASRGGKITKTRNMGLYTRN